MLMQACNQGRILHLFCFALRWNVDSPEVGHNLPTWQVCSKLIEDSEFLFILLVLVSSPTEIFIHCWTKDVLLFPLRAKWVLLQFHYLCYYYFDVVAEESLVFICSVCRRVSQIILITKSSVKDAFFCGIFTEIRRLEC